MVLTPSTYMLMFGSDSNRYYSDSTVVELMGTVCEETSPSGRQRRKPKVYAVLSEFPKVRFYQLERHDFYKKEIIRMSPSVVQTYVHYNGQVEAFERSMPFHYYKGNPRWDTLTSVLYLDPKEKPVAVLAKPKQHFVRKGSIVKLAGHWWRVKEIELKEADLFVVDSKKHWLTLSLGGLTAADSARLVLLPRPNVESVRLKRLF